jgi:hypothetical protein
VSIQKAIPALRIFAGSAANDFDREELTTLDQNQSWVGGVTYPVSYSFTLLSAASAPPYPFQTQIFLLPVNLVGNPVTGNEYMDYQATNSLWLQLQSQSNGIVIADVAWKTNLPNSNPNQTALLITNSQEVGTWTLTFNSATSGTLTAPGASPAAFTITDPNVTADFANPMIAAFGLQPNSPGAEGLYNDYTKIQTIGVAGTPVNDNFTTDSVINATVWDTSNSAQPSSLVLATTNTPYWVYWTLPDTGFEDGLSVATNLTTDPWHLPEYYNDFGDGNYIPSQSQQGLMRWTLVPSTCLPTADGNMQDGQPLSRNAFFKLFNPPLSN